MFFWFFSHSPTVFISPLWPSFTSRRGCSRKAASMGKPVRQWVGRPESHRDNGPGSPVRWLTGRASNPPGSSRAFPAALGRKTLRKGAWRPGWGGPWQRLGGPWKAKEKKKDEVSHSCAQKRMRSRKTRGWLWPVGSDAGSHGHQSESQDEAQGEVDEGGAAQQHGQVEDGHQLQHPPALLRALARQQPLRNSTTHRSHSGITTRTVTERDGEKFLSNQFTNNTLTVPLSMNKYKTFNVSKLMVKRLCVSTLVQTPVCVMRQSKACCVNGNGCQDHSLGLRHREVFHCHFLEVSGKCVQGYAGQMADHQRSQHWQHSSPGLLQEEEEEAHSVCSMLLNKLKKKA